MRVLGVRRRHAPRHTLAQRAVEAVHDDGAVAVSALNRGGVEERQALVARQVAADGYRAYIVLAYICSYGI